MGPARFHCATLLLAAWNKPVFFSMNLEIQEATYHIPLKFNQATAQIQ
jgi:hypothetical protein